MQAGGGNKFLCLNELLEGECALLLELLGQRHVGSGDQRVQTVVGEVGDIGAEEFIVRQKEVFRIRQRASARSREVV